VISIKCNRDSKIWAKELCKSCYNTQNQSGKDSYNSYHREYRQKNKDILKEKKKLYLEKNPQVLERKKISDLKRKYLITEEKVTELLNQTNCGICGGTNQLCIDHNHTTLEVRERLCKACNFAPGFLEKTEWVNKATKYLEKYDFRSGHS